MQYEPREGDIVLTGIRAQALVSRAIKLGSVLRHQKVVAWCATVAQLAVIAASVVLALTAVDGTLADIAVLVGGFVASHVAVWLVAAVGMRRDAFWARFSHAGVVVRHPQSGKLMIAEALAHGVCYSPIDKYDPENCRWIADVVDDEHDLEQFRRFAGDVIDAKTRYGFVVFLSLFVYCVTASLTFLPTIVIMQSGTAICSGFVCDALRPAGYIWRREAFFMMPADIVDDFIELRGGDPLVAAARPRTLVGAG